MSRAPNYPKVAAFAGLLLGLNLVDGASRMNVEARLAVQRTFAMPIERRGADAALHFGFGATWRVFEGAHIRLTPVSRKRIGVVGQFDYNGLPLRYRARKDRAAA